MEKRKRGERRKKEGKSEKAEIKREVEIGDGGKVKAPAPQLPGEATKRVYLLSIQFPEEDSVSGSV